ncbi:MAG: PorP/SprF family type IX secretion system membrane protein [Bacteroidetes bacterium]|nr:PorP/SprF family type IX secretion system membrane protein [Bacteroidota bacterium]HET6243736.1 PorP/SprF family type IX secretion system membrane protein [Bacteroidia bacterium]
MKRILLILFFFTATSSLAQDPLHMQAYSNPIVLNPAFSGGSEGPTLYSNYRYQWPGVSAPYKTFRLSMDIPVDKMNNGFGFFFEDDRSGDILTKNAYLLSYGYSLNLGETISIRAGLKGGIRRSKLDVSKLTYGDMIDPRRGFIYETNNPNNSINTYKTYADLGAGLLLSANKFDFGFAMDHLNRPNISHSNSSSRLAVLASFHGSYTAGSERLNVSPYFIFKKHQQFQHLILGTYFNVKKVFCGLAYYSPGNSTNGAVVCAGLNLKYVRIGYSYDIMFLSFLPKPLGSHEMMLSVFLPGKKERKKLRVAHNPLYSPMAF